MSGQPTKDELKQKLKEKIQQKQAKRMPTIKKCNNKYKSEDDDEIMTVSQQLIDMVPLVIKRTGKDGIPQLDTIFRKVNKYNNLRTKYFHLYRGILSRQVTRANLHLLSMLLSERAKERQHIVESEQAHLNIGYKLAEEYNVDVNALVKAAKEMAEKEAEEKKE